MAGCDVLYFDPTQVGQPRRDPAGRSLGPPGDGWRPCTCWAASGSPAAPPAAGN